jgi:hypothetical protein
MLSNLNIQSIDQIRQAGYKDQIPKKITQFIPWIRMNQMIAKLIARL